MTDKIDTTSRHITKAGGNIFAELGIEPSEAEMLLAKSKDDIAQTKAMKRQLMSVISDWMEDKGHKQSEAAKLLHISRPRVSDVVNQKTEKFTLDSLVTMVASTGKHVKMTIE